MSNRTGRTFLTIHILLVIVLTGFIAASQTSRDTQDLLPEQTLERKITGVETHRYRITLQKHEFFQVRVEQKGVDVMLKLLDANDGTVLATMDSPNGKEGPETLSLVAANTGAYTLEVSGFDKKAEQGSYTIRREATRPATAQDRRRVEVERLFVDGMMARNIQSQAERAIEKLKVAQARWQELGDRYLAELTKRQIKQLTAETVFSEAMALSRGGTAEAYRAALRKLEEARQLFRESGDQSGEAESLIRAGYIYSSLGEKHQALEYFDEALPLTRAVANKKSEATTLNNIGGVYSDLGQKQKALDYFNQALPLRRAVGDRSGEAATLNSIGTVYSDLGEKKKALEYFNQSLLLRRAVGDRRGEAVTLSNIGLVYADLGEYEKALDFYSQALSLFTALGDRNGEATTLNNIGLVYFELGEKQKALEYYNQALPLHRTVGNKSMEATTLNNIGEVYRTLGDMEKALDHYNNSLPLLRAIGNKVGEARTLDNIGKVYAVLGEMRKALDYFFQALPLNRAVGDRSGEAATLSNIGGIYAAMGERQAALDYLGQALPLFRAVGQRSGEAVTLSWLMSLWHDKLWHGSKPNLAIFYGKQSVNIYQELRGNIEGLDKDIQKTFLHSIEHTYRALADLLISQGRLPEAQAVLDLLKEEEFAQLVRRSGGASELLPYSGAELVAVKLIDQLATIGRHRFELLDKQNKLRQSNQNLQASELEQLNQLEQQISEANRELRRALEALAGATVSASNRIEEIRKEQSLMRDLRELGPGVVALYTVIAAGARKHGDKSAANSPRTGWVILVTPDFRKAYPIDVTDLEQTVFAFREALRTDKYDPRPLGQQLYRMLFLQTSPQQKSTLSDDLQAYLANSGEKTLMWSLDGVLRYVPIAALHDGRQYLIERYRNVVFNTASLGSLKDRTNKHWTALGLGVSEAREEQGRKFLALSGAERELRAIVREQGVKTSPGVLPGVIRLNRDFNKQSMTEGLRAGHPVVHIASHFSFNVANPEESFLLLGEDHLSVGELQDMSNPFEKVELLTLSACDTAMGSANGKEVEGFAYTAQSLGAKAVIASLWPVSDDGTDALMTTFYMLRRDNLHLPKGEAFRQAQLSLLNGTKEKSGTQTSNEPSEDVRAELAGVDAARDLLLFQRDPQKPFSHPYYWAPFILIGNWK